MTKRITIRTLLPVFDTASFLLAFTFAYYLRNFGFFRVFLSEIQPPSIYVAVIPFAVALLLAIFYFAGLYTKRIRTNAFTETFIIIKSSLIWSLVIMSGSYLTKTDYSRILVFTTSLFSLLVLIVGRYLFRRIEWNYHKSGNGVINYAIIGAGKGGRVLAKQMMSYSQFGYQLAGFIDDTTRSQKGVEIIGRLSKTKEIIIRENIGEVFVSDPSLAYDMILNLLDECKGMAKFTLASDIFTRVSGKVDPSKLKSLPSIPNGKSLWIGVPKRLFDIVIGTILYIISSPLWLVVGVLIFFGDGSPIIIRQKRVGLNGKYFVLIKFRTMKVNTNEYAPSPRVGSDNRVTKIGKFLRKSSLDELPQLLNVIRGDMSLVGPRPEMSQIVGEYKKWEMARLSVKPGITGLWQVLGRKDLPMQDNLEYDFYYVRNVSFLLDMTILIKTIPVVLLGKGAY